MRKYSDDTESTSLLAKSSSSTKKILCSIPNPPQKVRSPFMQGVTLFSDSLNAASGYYASVQPFQRHPSQIGFNIVVIAGFLEKFLLEFFKSKSPQNYSEGQGFSKLHDKIKSALKNPDFYENFNQFFMKFGFLWPSMLGMLNVIEKSPDFSENDRVFYSSAVGSALCIVFIMYISKKNIPNEKLKKIVDKISAFFEGYIVTTPISGMLSVQNFFLGNEISYLDTGWAYFALTLNFSIGLSNTIVFDKKSKATSNEVNQGIIQVDDVSSKKAFDRKTPFKMINQLSLATLFFAYLTNNYAVDNQDNVSMPMLYLFVALAFLYFSISTINTIFFREDEVSTESLFEKARNRPFSFSTGVVGTGRNVHTFLCATAKNSWEKTRQKSSRAIECMTDCCGEEEVIPSINPH